MSKRGVGNAEIARAVGRSEIAVRIAIGSRRPAPAIVQTRLRAWLEAPEVAAPTTPFPGSRGNGHAEAFSSAA
jgi:hypothetical protein